MSTRQNKFRSVQNTVQKECDNYVCGLSSKTHQYSRDSNSPQASIFNMAPLYEHKAHLAKDAKLQNSIKIHPFN